MNVQSTRTGRISALALIFLSKNYEKNSTLRKNEFHSLNLTNFMVSIGQRVFPGTNLPGGTANGGNAEDLGQGTNLPYMHLASQLRNFLFTPNGEPVLTPQNFALSETR